MSKNLENQNISQVENVTEEPAEVQKTDSVNEVRESADNLIEDKKEFNPEDALSKIFQVLKEKKEEIENDKRLKTEYLSNSLANYNTENYLLNPEFTELYSEAFNALGTNLDTEKFVNLLDKYVASRIQSHLRQSSAKEENENLTDSMDFRSGSSKQAEKTLRMQDIPPEELEKYIAKYI